MSESRSLHVLVAGGGLAGLAVAQGALKAGHTVDIFERDADLNRKQGYYLHINAIGGEALRRVLPDDLFDLYLETSRASYQRHESIVLDSQLNELSSNPHMGPPNPGPRNHTGVHRRTLRQILSARLGDHLHIGNQVVSYTQDADGVQVTLADGSTVRGDVLVGADGIRSAVRTQLLPQVPVINTGIKGIGVYGRTPLTPELIAVMPEILNNGVLMAIDPRKGTRLLIATFVPRAVASEAAKRIAPDVELDDVPGYVMVSCTTEPGTVVPPAGEWTAETPQILRDSMQRSIEGWHPAAQALVSGMELDSMFMIPFGFLEPAENWESSRVTIVGDAAHGMLPTLGMGANLALHDAALLTEQLEQVAQGAGLTEAIGRYEEQMRQTAYPILRLTIDHDKNFGGGALARAQEGAGAA